MKEEDSRTKEKRFLAPANIKGLFDDEKGDPREESVWPF